MLLIFAGWFQILGLVLLMLVASKALIGFHWPWYLPVSIALFIICIGLIIGLLDKNK